jgi:choline dehydrogenase-like flavoprotein
MASKEVIISAGSYRSPHLLILSGVGDSAVLTKYDIPVVFDAPDVGAHFYDHNFTALYWKLKTPGTALGDAILTAPQFFYGLPCDYLAYWHDPAVAVAAKDEGADEDTVRSLADPERCHTEHFTIYAVAGHAPASIYKTDGATATTAIMGMTPTSRGSITISSADPTVAPVIDPNYFGTEADRVAIRNTMRKVLQGMLETEEGKSIVEAELTDTPGYSDEAIDARIRASGGTAFHPSGSCSMGKVVDGQCRVIGLDSLRVVDASIIPLPIAAHTQATVFALAEKAADMI